MSTTTKNEQEACHTLGDLKAIQRAVKREVKWGWGIDQENLASSIWLELWEKRLPVKVMFVRARVIDEIRKRVRRREMLRGDLGEGEEIRTAELRASSTSDEEMITRKDIVDGLVKRAALSQGERVLLYLRFWRAMNGSEIGVVIGMSRSRVNAKLAEIMEKLRPSDER